MPLLLVLEEHGESVDRLVRWLRTEHVMVPFFCVHSKRCWWDRQQKAQHQEVVCFLLQARENQMSHLT